MDCNTPLQLKIAYHYLLDDRWSHIKAANGTGRFAVCWTFLNNLCFNLGGLGSTDLDAEEGLKFLYKIGAVSFNEPPIKQVLDLTALDEITARSEHGPFIYYRSILRSTSSLHFDDVIYELTDHFICTNNLLGFIAELERKYRGY
jgi:hypothetical protein